MADEDRTRVLDADEKQAWFDLVWKQYPDKSGKKQAIRHYNASVKTEGDRDDIYIALLHYTRSERVQKGFVQNGSTWFNNWRDWINPTKQMMGRQPKKTTQSNVMSGLAARFGGEDW